MRNPELICPQISLALSGVADSPTVIVPDQTCRLLPRAGELQPAAGVADTVAAGTPPALLTARTSRAWAAPSASPSASNVRLL